MRVLEIEGKNLLDIHPPEHLRLLGNSKFYMFSGIPPKHQCVAPGTRIVDFPFICMNHLRPSNLYLLLGSGIPTSSHYSCGVL